MGFMDKAKKMAEQAQAKLDEKQKQFNTGQRQDQPSGPAVEYDEHGRPIPQPSPPIAQPGVPPSAGARSVVQPGVPPASEEPPPRAEAPSVAEPGVPPSAGER